MAKAKKEVKKESSAVMFTLTKPNGKIIKRNELSDVKKDRLKKKGWKIKEA
tara:strand:- start:529 stop:681 length:153 start_codon:yes stop_codon:yes gene_type:complete